MPEPLRLRVALDKPSRPLTGDFQTTVLIEAAPARALRRLSLNLGILLDTSESMAGAKLNHACGAVEGLAAQLQPGDVLSLVDFSTDAVVRLRGAPAGPATLQRVSDVLDRLRAEGVTNLQRGLDTVLSELRRHATAERSSFAVLLSDGYPTTTQGYVDTRQTPYFLRVDREMRDHGVSLSAIGLGDAANYDQAFLRRLADSGNGRFHYCQSVGELVTGFSRELMHLQRSVLADVMLHVRGLGGTIRRLWRVYPDKKLFHAPEVIDGGFDLPIGVLQDEVPQAFLLDIVTGARPAGRARLMEVAASWRMSDASRVEPQPVVLEWTDEAPALAQRNPEVVRLAAECLDALLEEELEEAVASGSLAQQTSVLARKKQLTARLGKTQATRVLEEMEESLAAGEPISQDALARSSQHTKPTQRLG